MRLNRLMNRLRLNWLNGLLNMLMSGLLSGLMLNWFRGKVLRAHQVSQNTH